MAKWRECVGGAARVLLGRELPGPSNLHFTATHKTKCDANVSIFGILRNEQRGEELPVASWRPNKWNGRVVLWLTEQGKAALFREDGSPSELVKQLLDAGIWVVGADLFNQGEFIDDAHEATTNNNVPSGHSAACFVYGYNFPLMAKRGQDVLSLVGYLKNHSDKPRSIELLALDRVAAVVALALSQCNDAVNRAALDTGGFRFGRPDDLLDDRFIPGGAKYGDLPGFLSLAAPIELWIASESSDSAAVLAAAYRATGAAQKLTFFDVSSQPTREAAIAWLLQEREGLKKQ
jgi:hypothetical protein